MLLPHPDRRRRRLVALTASSGALDTTFGGGGFIDIGVTWAVSAGYKNSVIVGSNNGEVTLGTSPGDTKLSMCGPAGSCGASRPSPSQATRTTAAGSTGGRTAGRQPLGWYFTLDEQREILYTSFGSPAGNYWGGDRPGANLYGNSVVAVDVNSGKYLWHFQTVHHDLWDSDQPSPPTLIDVTRNGRRVPALGLIGKTAWMFVLDRTSGEPVFGVEERPLPRGEVPGEWYSPTQPFPVKPGPLGRIDFKKEDLVTAADTTPEHEKNCLALWERPVGSTMPARSRRSSITGRVHREKHDPVSRQRGTNWGGPAGDPALGYIYALRRTRRSPAGSRGSVNANYAAATDRRSRTIAAASPARVPTRDSPASMGPGLRRDRVSVLPGDG